jgi:hypothetical protein
MRIRNPIPRNPQEWLDEIARAYLDARETMPYGSFVGQVITEKDLYHMAPAVCLKFRGFKQSDKLLKKATDAALSSYVATRDLVGDLLEIPQIAFAFCYLASHYGLDLVGEEVVDSVMEYLEREKQALAAETSSSGLCDRTDT